MTTTAASDGTASKLAIALLGAVIAVVVRALWDLWRDRSIRRRRDWLVLKALLKEIWALQGSSSGLGGQMGNESAFFVAGEWSVKPFRRLPTGIYDLVKSDPPLPLLKSDYALSNLLTIQVQAEFTNSLIDAQERWKMQGGPLNVIMEFHPMLAESLDRLDRKLGEILPIVQAATAELEKPKVPLPSWPGRKSSRAEASVQTGDD